MNDNNEAIHSEAGIEYTTELELDTDGEFERSADGVLTLIGDVGKFEIEAQYRATISEYEDPMVPRGEILVWMCAYDSEGNEVDRWSDEEWQLPTEEYESWDDFERQCRGDMQDTAENVGLEVYQELATASVPEASTAK